VLYTFVLLVLCVVYLCYWVLYNRRTWSCFCLPCGLLMMLIWWISLYCIIPLLLRVSKKMD
jgi:hypothetical protein